ncbi:MAG: hypothetical protein ACPLSJ_04990 [Thermosulfidibacteraceae bacterium]
MGDLVRVYILEGSFDEDFFFFFVNRRNVYDGRIVLGEKSS